MVSGRISGISMQSSFLAWKFMGLLVSLAIKCNVLGACEKLSRRQPISLIVKMERSCEMKARNIMSRTTLFFALGFLVALMLGPGMARGSESPMEQLGKLIFFDENLSTPPGQSCAACHAPETGFTGPDSSINAAEAVYPGVVHTRSGNRKPPTAAYGGESPVLHYDEGEEVWVGGMFWDGRATGWILGDPLAEQAQGPFLNPLEQNSPNAKLVLIRIAKSDYASVFEEVWGPGSLDFVKDVAGSYERVARSIAAYEESAEVNPFTSKYDSYLVPVAERLKNSRSVISVLFKMLPLTVGFPQPVYGGSFCLPIPCFWTQTSCEIHQTHSL